MVQDLIDNFSEHLSFPDITSGLIEEDDIDLQTTKGIQTGASKAMLLLQRVRKYPAKDMAMNRALEPGASGQRLVMTRHEAYIMGKTAMDAADYNRAIEWFNVALELDYDYRVMVDAAQVGQSLESARVKLNQI